MQPPRFLTDKGIEYLREYLNLPADVVPATLKKAARPIGERPRPMGDRPRGDRPPREGGFGRDSYRREGGGGFGRGGDKASAPGDYQPRFGGFGRGSAPQ